HALGESGRERVRRHFLIPRMVLDELTLMRRLSAGATAGREFEWVAQRDPVCGMAIQGVGETLAVGGVGLRFCSRQCRDKLMLAPDRYLGRSPPAPASSPGAHAGAPWRAGPPAPEA